MVASQTLFLSNLFTCTYCKSTDKSFTGTIPLGKIHGNSVETSVATSTMPTPKRNATTCYLGMRLTSAVRVLLCKFCLPYASPLPQEQGKFKKSDIKTNSFLCHKAHNEYNIGIGKMRAIWKICLRVLTS